MARAGAQIRKTLIFIHRWMGVPFCLLFLLWFLSGIAMMYCDFPGVSASDRLSRLPSIDPSAIKLSPERAYASLGRSSLPDGVRLSTFDGRPVYRFRSGDSETIVYADNGQEQSEFPAEMTLRIAAAWTGRPAHDAKIEENESEDQWTVSGEFADLRPLLKYTWPDGEQVYVSTVTGDVVQYTTTKTRLEAYLGPIPHWLYFTALRKHGQQWSEFVIWASGLAVLAALLGIVVAVSVYSPGKRFQYEGVPSSLPYTGWKRWHSILGLIFGVLVCTWAFSGMLSMDPFPQLQRGGAGKKAGRLADALRRTPIQFAEFAAKSSQEALAELGPSFPVKELELVSFGAEPVYLAYAGSNETRIVPVRGKPAAEFDGDRIAEILREAARPEGLAQVRLVTRYESYYLDRHGALPLPVIFAELNDEEHSAYYVAPKTATIVKGYDARSRRNRWLYHGLHSMDFPALYNHRPAWDIVVLTLMLGGTSLCITSLKLAWNVLRRDRRGAQRPPVPRG